MRKEVESRKERRVVLEGIRDREEAKMEYNQTRGGPQGERDLPRRKEGPGRA